MTERREETLILKRNPDAEYSESYNALFEGRHVGRIYKAVSHAPREAPWFWSLDFHEWQGSDGPEYLGLIHRRISKNTLYPSPGAYSVRAVCQQARCCLDVDQCVFRIAAYFAKGQLSAQPIKGLTYHSEASAKVFSMRQTSLGAPEM